MWPKVRSAPARADMDMWPKVCLAEPRPAHASAPRPREADSGSGKPVHRPSHQARRPGPAVPGRAARFQAFYTYLSSSQLSI